MVNKLKNTIIISAISTFLFVPVVNAEEINQPDIFINGGKTEIKGNIVSGRTLVPLRSICENLGSTVLWNNSEKKITVVKQEKKVEMKLDENFINIDGHEKRIDVAPQVIGSSTYVPLRFLSENLGFDVAYDEALNSVQVNSNKENPIVITNEREKKDGDVIVDIQYPQITGLANKKVEDKINSVLKKHVEDFKSETKDFDNEVKELRKEGFKWNYSSTVNYDVKYNEKGLLSIVFTNYVYTGGAHGSYDNISYTFDLLTGDVYNLADLFHAGATNYKVYINKFIKDQNDKLDNKLINFESISDNQKYYLSNNGIVIYFDLYQYTSYAEGIPEFTVPYEYDVLPNLLHLDNFRKDFIDVVNNKNMNNITITASKELETDNNLLLDVRYPQLNGLKYKDTETKVNSIIKEYAQKYKHTEMDKYASISGHHTDESSEKYIIGLDYKIKYNYHNIICIVFTEYLYTGGAHGKSSQQTFTINVETGEEYKLNDLFKDGTDYVKEIDKLVKKKVNIHQQKEFINFESINKSEEYLKNFYLDTDGSVVIYFQHYDIAPYALGILEFPISNEEIHIIAKDWVIKDITDYSLNDCFGLKNDVQQKSVIGNLDTLLNNNVNAKDLARFINNNIAYMSKENASKLILALEDVQKRDISKYSEKLFSDDIQQKIIKEFKYDFDISKVDSIKDDELKDFLVDLRDGGYKVFETEGMYSPIIDYSRYLDANEYVTEDISDYIKIMAEESSKISHDDAAIVITWDEVYKRYSSQEKFINAYPECVRVKEIKEIYNWYVSDYLFGTNNTPAFDYDTNKLKNELLESYKKAVSDNSNSKISELLKEYLNLLESNGYIFNDQVQRGRQSLFEKLKV